jgi:TRAP-type C4-dicarboxylate transport system substrate-binding protein
MQGSHPAGDGATQRWLAYAEEVSKRTDGRMKLEVHYAKGLGYAPADALNVVNQGLIPANELTISYLEGQEPWFKYGTLPFASETYEEARIQRETAYPYLIKYVWPKWHVVPLAQWVWDPMVIFSTKEIKSLVDMKGMKIRVFGTALPKLMIAVDATPVSMPFGEVPVALRIGTVDAAVTSYTLASSAKLYEAVKYVYATNIFFGSDGWLVANEASFKKLPEDIQQVMKTIAVEFNESQWEAEIEAMKKAQAQFTSQGVKILVPPKDVMAKFKEATKPIWDDWAGSVKGAQEYLEEFETKVGR